ncbi:MAG: HPr family phosphocarrier protein [Lachnospiraceae bacterium]
MKNVMERRIKLRPDEVKTFVSTAMKCDFDIDISYNRYIVDAKSIVGVLGLDFSKPLVVRYSGYNEEFENLLRGLSCAC